MNKRTDITERLALLMKTWELHAPENKFGGMTLPEFKTATDPSREIRTEIEGHRNQVRGAIASRGVIDKASGELFRRVVFSVLGDVQFGPNSNFYRALGYVPTMERASGLRRTGAAGSDGPAVTTAAAAPTA